MMPKPRCGRRVMVPVGSGKRTRQYSYVTCDKVKGHAGSHSGRIPRTSTRHVWGK